MNAIVLTMSVLAPSVKRRDAVSNSMLSALTPGGSAMLPVCVSVPSGRRANTETFESAASTTKISAVSGLLVIPFAQ